MTRPQAFQALLKAAAELDETFGGASMSITVIADGTVTVVSKDGVQLFNGNQNEVKEN